MIRGALAVVLATALLAATFPALDDARRDHTATAVGTELEAIERAADRLLATDDVVREGGARRVVTLRFPAESWADAGIETVTIGSAARGPGATVTWTVAGGRRHERRLPDVPIETGDGEAIQYQSAGSHRLVLTLAGASTDPVLTVRRFKSNDGTSAAHATLDSRQR